MLQSEKVIKNYHDRINELDTANRNLAAEIKKDKGDLKAANEQYTQLVKEGKDDQADALIEDIEALEQSIKKKSKRLATKESLEEAAYREEAYKALAHVPHIQDDFNTDVAESDKRLKALLSDMEKELAHRKSINDQYKDIYTDFIQIRDDNKPEGKEERKEYGGNIRPYNIYSNAPDLISDNVNLPLAVQAYKKRLGVK